MIGISIGISEPACIGCGACVELCPTDVLMIDEKIRRPRVVYEMDCEACFICELACPTEAIRVSIRKIPED